MRKIARPFGDKLPFDLVFVCGAPRSGTTLLLGLICTSSSTNALSTECDYLTALIPPFIVGRNRFDIHTNCYFESLEDFEHYHANLLRSVLTDIWDSLGRPAKLVLKDPGITRYANIVLKLLPECRVVVSIRDPKDIVASRVAIEMRRLGCNNPAQIGGDFIDIVCREYNAVHEFVLSLDQQDLRRAKMIRYEQLVEGICLPDLADFVGIADIEPARLWQRSLVNMKERRNGSYSEWVSPLYEKQMSNEPVGRHHSVLGLTDIMRIDSACTNTHRRLLAIGGWSE